jgi:hypothetical protein
MSNDSCCGVHVRFGADLPCTPYPFAPELTYSLVAYGLRMIYTDFAVQELVFIVLLDQGKVIEVEK